MSKRKTRLQLCGHPLSDVVGHADFPGDKQPMTMHCGACASGAIKHPPPLSRLHNMYVGTFTIDKTTIRGAYGQAITPFTTLEQAKMDRCIVYKLVLVWP